MPRFLFDIDDGERNFRDEEGSVHADVEAARLELISTLAQIAKDVLPDDERRVFRGAVRDEHGAVVYEATLTLRDAWAHEPQAE